MQQIWELLQGMGSAQMAEVGLVPFLAVMLLSLASSLFIAWLYQVFFRARATGSQVHHAFPLLGISITAIFVSLQFSLPLSLGLLGALSIVRFRTPIKEPEEIGFVLLVIAASLCNATFNLGFLAVLLVVAVVALLVMKRELPFLRRSAGDGSFLVSLPPGSTADDVSSVLSRLQAQTPTARLEAVTESEAGVSISAVFSRLEPDGVPALLAAVKRVNPRATASAIFHRAGDA